MQRSKSNTEFLNGVPELLILQLLSRRPMYGYQLVQAIGPATDEALQFGEGCVYPILHRLERDAMLASRRQTVGGRSRVVYRVTHKGERRLAGSVAQWRQVAAAINHVLMDPAVGTAAPIRAALAAVHI